ncbi:MAG: multidrug ABC transporter substrate-binding protein [Desulfobacterales bacterium S3730MH5]|nr:MAG: multidrug ABC transporter substrate-binding protein [Desulfobacterales bacterium S3730MH5]
MKGLDAFFDALRSIRTNSLRSVLTTLGIIIGVGAVIIMVSVGNGAKAKINKLIESIGANIMMVTGGSSRGGGVRRGAGSLPTLTEDDAWTIQKEISSVIVAAPSVSGSVQVVKGNMNWATSARGITSEYITAREWKVKNGRFFEPSELKRSAKVALLGKTVADNLFFDQDPVGQTIRIKKVPFLVIGVLSPKGQTGHGRDQDDVVMIPLTTAKKRILGGRRLSGKLVSNIVVKARSAEEVPQTEEQVKELLRQRHRIRPGQEDDFRVRNLAEIMNTRADSSKAMNLLLMSVASISLMVGGIGIMNIMLVSVTERTREIGLRMAVGATGGDIMSQFLIESVVLSLIGGLIGAILGIGGSLAMSAFSQWQAIIDPKSVLLAFGFSAAVGIFFGFYPAHKASLLNPIEALRHE